MEDEYLDKLDDALNSVTSKKSEAELYTDKIKNALGNTSNIKGLSGDINYFGGQGFGDSRYDDYTLTEHEFDMYGNDVNEMRAQRQPWIDKAGAGLVRVGAKVAAEVAKMPGMLVGSAAAPFSEDPWGTAFNNTWIKAIENFAEHINDENLPVYVKKAVSEGNLWDNISSIDFWATEGADGVGYIASMLVPGLALSKIGAGSKIVKGLSKGGSKVLGGSEKALDFMKSAGITGKNIDVLNATLANTLFEAGAEAGHAMQNFEDQLTAQLKNGDITQFEFNEAIKRKGQLGRDMFIANAGILLGPNLITNKILLGGSFGKAVKRADFYKKGSTQLIEEVAKTSGRKRALGYAKEYGKGFLREGFFEEGLQTATENLYGDAALTGDTIDYLSEIGTAYVDMINTTDGQKAIFLGGFLGGPMNVYQKHKEGKAEQARKENLLSAMQNSLSSFSVTLTDIYKKDNKGDYILDKKGMRIIDPIKSKKVGAAITQIEDLNDVLEVAQITGNKDLADGVRAQINSALVVPFITEGEVGLEVLKQQLEGMSEIAENVEKYNNAYGTNLNKRSFISDIMSMAESMKKDYERFETYGRDIISLENKEASREEKEDFHRSLQHSYLLTKARTKYMEKYLGKLTSEKAELDSEYNAKFAKSKEAQKENSAELLEKIKNNSPIYKSVNDLIKQTEELLEQLTKQEESFFDSKQTNREFNKLVNLRKVEDKKLENKEDEKVEKAVEDIGQATTEKAVDEAVKTQTENVSKETKDYVDKVAETKKEQLEDKKVNESSEQINKITKEADEVKNSPFQHAQNVFIENEEYILNQEGDKHFRTVGISDFNAPHSGKVWSIEELAEVTGQTFAEEVTDTTEPVAPESTEGGELTKGVTKINTVESVVYFNNEGEGNTEINKSMPSSDELAEDEITREHVKVIGVDQSGNPLSNIASPTYIEYLRNGMNKIGEEVTFELGEVFNEASEKAINFFYELPDNVKTLDDLIALDDPKVYDMLFHLPIKVRTKEGHTSFITGRPAEHSKKTAKEIFNQNELPLRKDIIMAAINNKKSFEGIYSTIEFQYPGLIKKAPRVDGKIPENNILDLYNIEDSIGVKLLFSANENGDLFNENKELVSDLFIGAGSKKGYVYMEVPMANGKPFPMKLNVSKVNTVEAEMLYRMFQEIFASKEINSIAMTLENFTPTLQEELKTNFKDEIKLFNKPYKDIKAYEFIELFVYSAKDSNYKFEINDGSLNYGPNRANKNSLPEFKNNIINWLTTNKRRHIDIGALSGTKDIHSAKYKYYLIKRGILNTDTIIEQPIFQGNTNIYISKNIKTGKKSENKSKKVLKSPENIVPLQQTKKNKEKIEKSKTKGFNFIKKAKEAKQAKGDTGSIKTKC